MDTRSGRWTAFAGAAFVVLILVGNGLSADGAPVGYDPDAQLAYLRDNTGTTGDTIGLGLELLGFALFPFFLARLWSQLRAADRGDGVLPMTALAAGVTMLAIKLGSGAELIALGDRADTLSGEQVQQLVDVNSATFVLSFLPFGVLLFAAGLATVRNGGLPRWLGWSALVLGAGNVVSSMTDPDGPMVVPFLLGLIWIVVTAVVMARRPLPHAMAPTTSAPEPVGATR